MAFFSHMIYFPSRNTYLGYDVPGHRNSDTNGADGFDNDVRVKEAAFALATLLTAAMFAFLLILTAAHIITGFTAKNVYVVRNRAGDSSLGLSGHGPVRLPTMDRTVVCTMGFKAVSRRWYPFDGICTYMIYTHVLFDPKTDAFLPSDNSALAWRSLHLFFRQASYARVSQFLPSLEWRTLQRLQADHEDNRRLAQGLNRSIAGRGLRGLGMLGVRTRVDKLPLISSAFQKLRAEVPDFFLVLGVSIEGVDDENVRNAVPTDILDALMTPLSMFILETHVPTPTPCRTAFSSAKNNYENPAQNFTLGHLACDFWGSVFLIPPHVDLMQQGAIRLWSHPAILYVDPKATMRCISFTASALVFRLPYGHKVQEPGEPCISSSYERIETVCNEYHVQHHVDAVATYGITNESFFSFETEGNLQKKFGAALQLLYDGERPACLAVYHTDLDDIHARCTLQPERKRRMPYVASGMLMRLDRSVPA